MRPINRIRTYARAAWYFAVVVVVEVAAIVSDRIRGRA